MSGFSYTEIPLTFISKFIHCSCWLFIKYLMTYCFYCVTLQRKPSQPHIILKQVNHLLIILLKDKFLKWLLFVKLRPVKALQSKPAAKRLLHAYCYSIALLGSVFLRLKPQLLVRFQSSLFLIRAIKPPQWSKVPEQREFLDVVSHFGSVQELSKYTFMLY